jgi:hypothetical protein
LKTLEALFEQVLQIALEAGAMEVGRVALDGTKIKANASQHKAMSCDRMGKKQKQLKAEVKQLLAQAAADAEEHARYGKNQSGDELPAELERRETRLQKIREAKRALERACQKAAAEGGDAKQKKPKEKDQYNFTDPESRIMKGADWFVQANNAQAAVASDLQLIVGSGESALYIVICSSDLPRKIIREPGGHIGLVGHAPGSELCAASKDSRTRRRRRACSRCVKAKQYF